MAKHMPASFHVPSAAIMIDSGDKLQCARLQLVCMKFNVSATEHKPCFTSSSHGPALFCMPCIAMLQQPKLMKPTYVVTI